MRKVFTFFVAVLIFAACKKQHNGGCVPATPSSESASIASFCLANGINATTDSNGIYYQIIDQGSGSKANMSSVITVTYSTSLLDGQMIDTTHFITPVTLPLNQFI